MNRQESHSLFLYTTRGSLVSFAKSHGRCLLALSTVLLMAGTTDCQKNVGVLQSVLAPTPKPKEQPPSPKEVVLRDVYFERGESALGNLEIETIEDDSERLKPWLLASPRAGVMIEGFCDSPSSAEYCLGLADRRASHVKELMVALGLPSDRLFSIVSEEQVQCSPADGDCVRKHRRVHLAVRP